MKYNPIGTAFKEGEHILQVRESKDDGRTCTGCWYASFTRMKKKKYRNYPYSCYTHGHACTRAIRKDKKQVVFTKINR
jgi:hypothetical protein